MYFGVGVPIPVAIGGHAYNIIPGELELIGSTRTFSAETRALLPALLEEIVRGICDTSGASYQFNFICGYASVINDTDLTETCQELIKNSYGKEAALNIDPVMPGKDFSALAKECPGFFVELGTRNEEKGSTVPHHNSRYLMDESALLYVAEYWVRLVRNRLNALS